MRARYLQDKAQQSKNSYITSELFLSAPNSPLKSSGQNQNPEPEIQFQL